MSSQINIWNELSDAKKARELSLSETKEAILARQISAVILGANYAKPNFEDKIFTPKINILIDNAPSMHFSSNSQNPTKFSCAKTIAFALEMLFKKHGLKTSLDEYNENNLKNITAKSEVILISDFLVELDVIDKMLSGFCEQKISGWLVHTLDFNEKSFVYSSERLFTFLDKKQKPILVKPEFLRKSYTNKLYEHCSSLINTAEKQNFFFAGIINNQSLNPLILGIYMSYMEKFNV